MKEHEGKLDAGSKSALESSIAKVNEAAKGEDVAAIESAIGQLEQAAQALYKHMAEAQGAGGEADAGAQSAKSAGGDEDVIDAEFEKSE